MDDRTVKVTANDVYFKNLELAGGFQIVPKHLWTGTNVNESPQGRKPLGSGPYRLLRWDTGREIVLERDPAWHGLARGESSNPQRIIYKFVEEPVVRLQLLKNGAIDQYDRIPALQWVRQLGDPKWAERFHKYEYQYPSYNYIGFNLRKPLFQDLRVRQALDHLVDREKVIKQIYQGFASPTSGFNLPSDPAYHAGIEPTAYDPEKARALLAEAGWTDTNGDGILDKDGKPFQFNFLIASGSINGEKIALLVQDEFKKHGIDVRILKLDWSVMLDRVKKWDFDVTAMGWALGLDGDPYQIWHGSQAEIKDSSNSIGYKNPEADRLMEEARKEFDPKKRNAMYRKLHEIIYNDRPVMFLVVPKQMMAVDKRWEGISIYVPRPCYDLTEWFVPAGHRRFE
jgi:peptide/nickel transport system substrate-binding protein